MTLVCVITAVCVLIAGLFAVIVQRTDERDDARRELARRDEAARMEARLTDPATATTVRVPRLRAVSGDPAVAEWDALLRATGDRL